MMNNARSARRTWTIDRRPALPKPNDNQPWLAYNEKEEYEQCITGNEQGLRILRDAIDQALKGVAARIDINLSDFSGVVKIEGDQREKAVFKNSRWELFKASLAALAVPVVIGFLFGVGVFAFKSTTIALRSMFK
jgi:hypothetical protein